jgi:two-component system cell cycle sensor histidine kinase/response regulator CckA
MSKTKILIVEDNPIVAEDLKTRCVKLGYIITAIAYSGKEAVDSIETDKPHLALMDIRLGDGMNGIDTASILKNQHNISVIYLTAHADDDTISRAKTTEPYGYIVKPFDDDELKSTIEIAVYKHKADQKILESRQWLYTTLNSIGDAVISTDNHGRIEFMNPVAEELTEWKETEVKQRPLEEVFKIINETTRHPVETPVKKVIETGRIIGLANHTLLVTRSGKEFPIADSGAPIKNHNNQIIGVVLVFRDQTKERLAEKQLLESEARFRILVESSPQLILLEQEGRYIYANPSAIRLLGYSTYEELIGQTVLSTIAPDYRTFVNQQMENIANDVANDPAEIKMLTKNSDEIWFLTHTTAVNYQGKKTAIIVGQEITKRIEAEMDYKRLVTAVNHIAEGIAITSPKPAIQYVNPAFEAISGYSKEELIGKNPAVLKSGYHDKAFYKDMWGTLLSGKIWSGRFQNRRKDGTLYFEDASIAPIVNNDGKIANYVAIKRDVTKELESEQQLRQSQKMESIGTLAGGIAHDFNNILTTILGFTQLALAQTEEDSTLKNDLNEILVAGNRAKDLVSQILTFARRREQQIAPIRPSLIAQEVITFIRSSIPSNIEIISDINSKAFIMADATQIHQVFMNICTNASQAMDNIGGKLSFSMTEKTICTADTVVFDGMADGKYIRIKISDTGVGISPDHLTTIFEPYYPNVA